MWGGDVGLGITFPFYQPLRLSRPRFLPFVRIVGPGWVRECALQAESIGHGINLGGTVLAKFKSNPPVLCADFERLAYGRRKSHLSLGRHHAGNTHAYHITWHGGKIKS